MSPVPPRSSRRYHVGTSIVSPLRYFPHSLVNRKPPEKNLQVRRNRRDYRSFSWIPNLTRALLTRNHERNQCGC
uniref:Uncharacterized protein n=1 Tax=Helianthus annuus TaxID=4232 RepID=A0A251UNE8_HELAN